MDAQTLADLPGQNEPSLDHLFSMAKIKKNELTLAQADYDQSLFALVAASGHEEEGSKTFTTNSGQKYRIIRKMNRRLDGKKLQLIRSRIPQNLLALKVEEVLDKQKLKYLQNNEPDTYRLMAQAIIATPGKAAIEFIDKEN
tara:strand:- start:417 stop:842 length:426 start_codon:yes stop_codon:yes gene_type:complete